MFQDGCQRAARNISARFAGNRYSTWFGRMSELPMTSSHADLFPAILLEQLDQFPHFHQSRFPLKLWQQGLSASVLGHCVGVQFQAQAGRIGNRQHAVLIELPPAGGDLVYIRRTGEVLYEVGIGEG